MFLMMSRYDSTINVVAEGLSEQSVDAVILSDGRNQMVTILTMRQSCLQRTPLFILTRKRKTYDFNTFLSQRFLNLLADTVLSFPPAICSQII